MQRHRIGFSSFANASSLTPHWRKKSVKRSRKLMRGVSDCAFCPYTQESRYDAEVVLGVESAAARDLRDAQIAGLQKARSLPQSFFFQKMAEKTSGNAVKTS